MSSDQSEFEITAETSRRIALVRQHLAPSALETQPADVVPIVREIGGLQDGWHVYELWNRFGSFLASWFDDVFARGHLCAAHVLRVALRYVPCEDLPYYFQATREVIRTRMTHGVRSREFSPTHERVLGFLRDRGPASPTEVKQALATTDATVAGKATRLLYELYHRGDVMRFGRKNGKPLYGVTALREPPISLRGVSEQEAHDWLFLKGLEAFGPLTVHEVAHWVGWRVTTARETLNHLVEQGRVTGGSIVNHAEVVWARTEDVDQLEGLAAQCDADPFVRIFSTMTSCYRVCTPACPLCSRIRGSIRSSVEESSYDQRFWWAPRWGAS